MNYLLFDGEVITQMPDDSATLELLNKADEVIVKLSTIIVSTLIMVGVGPNDVPEVAQLLDDGVHWLDRVRKELGVTVLE